MKINRYVIIEYFNVIVGSYLTALGIALFSAPSKIVNGGVSGIAIIVHHSFGWDTGFSILLFSIPLFLLGFFVFGKRYALKSLAGTILLSAFTTMNNMIFGYEGVLDPSNVLSVLLSALSAGALMGLGLGMVVRSGSNTGGTDILAQVVARYTPLSMGTSFLIVDGLIILIGALIFGLEMALYALITVFITSVAIDKVVLAFGRRSAKTVFIISTELEAIKDAILTELGNGGTILSGIGMYTRTDRPVIMTVVANTKLAALTHIVHRYDKNAFMVVQEAFNVLGEGFTPIEEGAWSSHLDLTQQQSP
jgi:uncharacterized membrane-anchored protein YitT (DUF2179 family)